MAGFAWNASRSRTIAAIALAVGTAAATLAGIVAVGTFIGSVPWAVGHEIGSARVDHVVRAFVVVVALRVAVVVLSPLQETVGEALSMHAARHLGSRILDAGTRPSGIAHLEDAAFADDVARARGNHGASITAATRWLPQVAQTRLTAAGSALILVPLRWWLPLLLVFAGVVQYRWLYREVETTWVSVTSVTEDVRRAKYLSGLALDAPAAKEVRVFGLASWLVDLFADQWRTAMAPVWRRRGQLRGQMLVATGMAIVAYGATFVTLARAGISGAISIAALATFAQAALRVSWYTGDGDYQLRGGALCLQSLVELELRSEGATTPTACTRPAPPRAPAFSIRFEGVSFAYPKSLRPVLDDLSLEVRAGSSLAIVGANGAGKTTLVKILAGLYHAQRGRVMVDGVDLAEVDAGSWRERVSVIFQDFVRYELSARDNVGFGHLADALDDAALDRVARQAGIDELVAGLPDQWDTVLSRAYRGGVDLSGGQWQRIALARALLSAGRGGLLVLDEPTANLDVRAEAELFERFLELTTGTTTILVSHRFSTVRRADRICVLELGRISEEGSHDELMALGGRYARMFTLQAARFLDAQPDA